MLVWLLFTFVLGNIALNCLLIQEPYSKAVVIGFRTEGESRAFHLAFGQWKKELSNSGDGNFLELFCLIQNNRYLLFYRVICYDLAASNHLISHIY